MGKIAVYLATTLNGKITKGESDSSWVSQEDEEFFNKVCAQFDAILVGRNTFEQFHGEIYPVKGVINIVLGGDSAKPLEDGVYCASCLQEVQKAMASLKAETLLVVGGAKVVGSCLKEGIVDTLYASVHPYIFANGLDMTGDFASDIELEFHEVVHHSKNMVLLRYGISSKNIEAQPKAE